MTLNKDLLVLVAQKYGTPAYVYDSNKLHKSYMELRNALPDYVDIFYALKVNPNTSLVKLIRSYGANTEVCSLGELEIALKAGVDPKDIIFLGPYKKEIEHKRALEAGVYTIVVESETELKRLSALAVRMNVVAPVAIRINPNFSAAGSPWKMGGRPTHFGIEEETAINNFGRYSEYSNIEIKGIHVYNGTKILEAKSIHDNCQYILNLYKTISEKHHLNFSMIDVGGGLGVKYYENENELDMVELKELLAPLFAGFHQRFPNTRIIMESGRFIAGRCASFLVTVDNLKENHGKMFAVTDGGTNCNASVIGSGQLLKRNFNIENVTKRPGSGLKKYNISGPLCTPDDLLGRDVSIEKLEEGDILAVTATGAYGPTASPVLFHSHGYPAEILQVDDKLVLIRKRDTAEDILSSHVDNNIQALTGQPLSAKNKHAPVSEDLQDRIMRNLRDVLMIPDDKSIIATSHLRDDFGLDSLSSVHILVELEDQVPGFLVNPDTILPRHFNTVETLAAYVQETLCLGGHQAEGATA
jgi:diaminopimelate decarboxylase